MKSLPVPLFLGLAMLTAGCAPQHVDSAGPPSPTPPPPVVAAGEECADHWRITGYFSPREDEEPGDSETVLVEGLGNASFPKPFLKKVKMEGWGLTRQGWYLGYWGGKWRKSPYPLDARGQRLDVSMVAVAPDVPLGTKVRLPSSPAPWNAMAFVATDHGGAIGSNHVDVYTGLGREAERKTFAVTTSNGRVCLTRTP